MEGLGRTTRKGEDTSHDLQIVRYSPFKLSSPWFDSRVFYVRISNYKVDDSTPEFLTLSHIPFSPDTLLEHNGAKASLYSEGISSFLRRDRVDKKSEEATFVSTDSVRFTSDVKFEVYDKKDLIISGVLERTSSNGFIGDSKSNSKRWNMDCKGEITAGCGFLKGKQLLTSELQLPTIEVYVAGVSDGTPIILTKSLELCRRKKHNRKGMLDSIPEYETTEPKKDVSTELDLQVQENDEECNKMYWRRTEYMDGEDEELSWFNAGVRVGVGLGLGICLGVGIGVGLFVRTYKATTRNFKKRLG